MLHAMRENSSLMHQFHAPWRCANGGWWIKPQCCRQCSQRVRLQLYATVILTHSCDAVAIIKVLLDIIESDVYRPPNLLLFILDVISACDAFVLCNPKDNVGFNMLRR